MTTILKPFLHKQKYINTYEFLHVLGGAHRTEPLVQPEEALRDQLERRGTLCVRSTQQGGRHCGVFQHYHRPLRINNLAWHTVATKCYELSSAIRD